MLSISDMFIVVLFQIRFDIFRESDVIHTYVFDLNINIVLEKYIGLPELPRYAYDECVLGLKLYNNDTFKDFVTGPFKTSFLENVELHSVHSNPLVFFGFHAWAEPSHA